MMKYNEWKILQESTFSLGLKTPPTVGGPIGGTGFYEGGFNLGKTQGDEDDYDDEDEDGEDDDEDGDLSDDQLDGDIFGADKSEGGPEKSFPPDDSEDMDGKDGMDDVLGGIDPDLAGLGDDKGGFGGSMGGIGGGGEMGGMGDEGGDQLGGGDDFDLNAMGDGGLGGDEMGGGLDDLGSMDGLGGGDEMGLGGDEMGGDGLDDMGDAGEPCPDCNPDGMNDEGDPACQSCHGKGHIDDKGGGEIGGDDMGHDIDMMNFMNHMKNYATKYMDAKHQKKFMGTGSLMGQQQPQAGQMQPQPQMNAQQMQQMMQQMQQQPKPNGAGQTQPQFQKKFMAKGPQKPVLNTRRPDIGEDMKKSYCGACENVVGTYKETHDDFLANLTSHAKGETRKKFSSGIKEDALLQAVDPNYGAEAQSGAGQFGFAPQGRIGAIGGGYTQQDMQDLPVLGESKKNSKKR